MSKFAERFNEAMRLKGIKQKDVVARTGLAPGTISNYARGKYAPKQDGKLEAIAEALGVTVSYLAGFSDDPSPIGDPTLDSIIDKFTRMTQPSSFGPVEVSPEELRVVMAYRNAEQHVQEQVRRLLDLEVVA